MGSYLVLNGNENNSKSISGMMINIIRGIDSKNIKNKWFKPDYYKDNMGCGDWVIHRKALALLCRNTKELLDNEEWIEEYTYENHEWHEFNGNKEEYYKHWLVDTKDDLKIVYNIFVSVLVNSVLYNEKFIYAHWE